MGYIDAHRQRERKKMYKKAKMQNEENFREAHSINDDSMIRTFIKHSQAVDEHILNKVYRILIDLRCCE